MISRTFGRETSDKEITLPCGLGKHGGQYGIVRFIRPRPPRKTTHDPISPLFAEKHDMSHFAVLELSPPLQQVANDVLVWIGFGTVIGLLAKGVMPRRDPGGAIATLAMGVGGTIIGCGVLSFFHDGQRVTPISPVGMLVGTAGAFSLLLFYRMLSGRFFIEGDQVPRQQTKRYTRRKRRYDSAVYED